MVAIEYFFKLEESCSQLGGFSHPSSLQRTEQGIGIKVNREVKIKQQKSTTKHLLAIRLKPPHRKHSLEEMLDWQTMYYELEIQK